ncbi:MAG TPA: (2Fe-2S)-binding protein [Blastocatellia bacterium]|nr:(2Fe-2S)-binding protein [Blastocatellia bacterium]
MKITININGSSCEADVKPNTSLLEFLREQGLWSVKHGCETGECGACAVLVNGKLRNTCIMLAAQARAASITTLEGIGDFDNLHPLQSAFVDCGAIQCGYCTPAMILAAYALSKEKQIITEEDVRDVLAGVLCRCTGYVKPVQAVLQALTTE